MNARTVAARSLHALDWLNFSLADVRSGLGPFLAILFLIPETLSYTPNVKVEDRGHGAIA